MSEFCVPPLPKETPKELKFTAPLPLTFKTALGPKVGVTDAPSDVEETSEDAPFIFKALFNFSFDPPSFPPPLPPPFSLLTYLLTVKSLIESSLDHQPPPYELGFPAPKENIEDAEKLPVVSQGPSLYRVSSK